MMMVMILMSSSSSSLNKAVSAFLRREKKEVFVLTRLKKSTTETLKCREETVVVGLSLNNQDC